MTDQQVLRQAVRRIVRGFHPERIIENRPLSDEESRAITLAGLVFVSAVVLFDEDTPLELIKKVKPDFLVKGGDYLPQDIVGYDFVTSYGGKVLSLNLIDGYSTTGLLKKINPAL